VLAGMQSPPPKSLEELLGPDLMARLDRLDLLSRKILAGKLPGERRSKRRGRSIEFDDFRNYVPGDDLRHIDWNIVARLDRLFIKLFREDQDLSLALVLDVSSSMNAGQPNKAVYAHRLAMALGYIGLVNQNRVTMTTFGRGVTRLAPMRGRTNIARLSAFLLESLGAISRATPGAATAESFAESMRGVTGGGAGRGVVVVMSDFLVPGGCADGLSYLGAATRNGDTDAYAVQILSPGELDPVKEEARGLFGDLRLSDVETGRGADVTVTPRAIEIYRKNLDDHNRRLRDDCMGRGIAHILVPTDTPIDALVVNTLRRGGMLR
jgi:uncharacterized protein (DUF58 family)